MRVMVLQGVMDAGHTPLGLYSIIRTSEDVRTSTIRALWDQYQRLAGAEPAPSAPVELSASPRQSRSSVSLPDEMTKSIDAVMGEFVQFRITHSCKSLVQFEPPSPPLTPPRASAIPDDLQSMRSVPSSRMSTSGNSGPRLKNSVFSSFCSEAMRYQLDPSRAIATRKCKCGYEAVALHMEDNPNSLLKDGFHLSPRFLMKSHFQRGGFGCVLCISTGATGRYDSTLALKKHIDASHDKWQMLHDRDLTSK
jgi:hypothetical protein